MRIVAWLLVLAVLVAFLWFNQRGVPDFVKRPILAELKARGLDVEFHRLRWQWFRGLVAEGIVVGQAGVVTGPHFSVGEVEVQLDSEALRHFQLIPRGVVLSQGGMTWKLAPSNLPPQVLLVTNLATTVRFLPNDVWELPQLNATVQGIQMKFSAVLTNATALRRPGAKSASPPTGPAEPARPGAEAILHRVLTELARVQFTAPPEIELALRADAKLERGFQADLKVQTRDVVTPWGSGRHANFTAKINQPPGTNGAANADFRLEAERLRTTNLILSAEHVLFTARLNRQSDRTNDWDAAWEVALRTGKSPWAEAATLRFSGQAAPRPLAPDEWRASGTLRTTGLKSEWGQLAEGRLSGNASFAPARKQLLAADAEAQLTAPQTKWGTAKQARVTAKATHVGAATSPAGLESGASAAWGFWTNLAPWQLETSVALDAVQAPAQSLDVAKFNFTARWRAPELIVTNLHSELYQGALDTSARLDVATRTLMASGGFDFDAYRIEHLLDANTRREMSRFTFTGLPKARAAVALVLPEWTNSVKNWRATGESVTLAAHVDSPGGSYRNATYLEANTDLTLTNGILRLRNLWARRPEGEVHLNYDVNPRTKEFHWAGRAQVFPHAIEPLLERPEEKRILTTSTFDPYAFTRMIGPQTERAIKAYEFSNAPSVRVNGSIPFREGDTTDLHFDIAGGPFRWSFFHLPQVTGTIHWVTNRLAITNLDGAFNGGRLAGDLNFDFTPRHSADFGFNLAFTNASLPGFIANLTGKPNKLEGTVAGTIVVTNANTADWQSWQGFGEVRLNDGLLWEFPIFGLFSPVLNAINKDLGNSRAKEAKGTFILTNSVIYTKNLEINSSPARLHYDGTVDFAGRVNAVVEAEMFRDTFLVGPILSFLTSPMTKVFEYKVTGSLANPKSEPRFIPKFLLLPLRPFQTIREFLTPEKSTPENK
ncbi:MAG: hypothetical protein EB082_00305 [Verrucomicrobia bacterium]|nr:hypothetical protein [Verrucomicrobiota bacterium]